MKMPRKSILATAVAITLTVGTGLIPAEAEAAVSPRSYYSYVEKFAKYPAIQERFVKQMIANYTRTLGIFEGIVSRYKDRFGGASWFQNIENTYNWYKDELAKYEAFLNPTPVAEPVLTIVDQKSITTYSTEVERSAPYVKETKENVVEERDGATVDVYAVLTTIFETEITTRRIATTTEFTWYSNGQAKTESSSKVIKETVTYEQTTDVTRELVKSYTIEATEQVAEADMGTPTLNVLTADEYMARDDVNLEDTDTYYAAVKKARKYMMNSLITKEGGIKVYGDSLEAVGAPEAWARGWTGEGSTIAILDTGINVNHSEFADKIVGYECFTINCNESYSDRFWYEGMEDLNGHGSHVAGIAAANLDGVGTTGVAPDADLLIAKTASASGWYDMKGMAKALGWASDNGAVVANVSANYNVSSTYAQALTKTGEGTYQLLNNNDSAQSFIDKGYNINGYVDVLKDEYSWRTLAIMSETFTDTEMVMVAAAGNQGLGFSTFPAHYAVYADEAGELLFDGRIIVAGSYDIRTEDLSTFSNAAGTVCYDTEIGPNTCDSGYRISDFYLMAPGEYVASVDAEGGYTVKSGTSMAAPTISGAVALVHQMWPHMTGNNLAKLLLNTGDKSFAAYDKNTHGQGLLDLDEATKPKGALGIPTSGRADATKTATVTGGVSVAGGSVAALSEVMVIDDYDRDFYVDANDFMVEAKDTRTLSFTVAHKDRVNTNAYAGYAYTQNLGGENTLVGLSENGKDINVAYDFANGFSVGALHEDGRFLGNVADSSLMRVNGTTTAYVGYNKDFEINKTVTMFTGAQVGFSNLSVDTSTMLKGASTLVSNTANVGLNLALNNTSEVGFVAALPVAITSGTAQFEVAQSVNADGTINYANVDSSFAPEAREFNLGAYYNFNDAKEYGDVVFTAYAEQRFNFKGVEGERDTAAGIQLSIRY